MTLRPSTRTPSRSPRAARFTLAALPLAIAQALALAQTPPPAPPAPAPNALPAGGQVTAGQATITTQGASMTVQQGSQRAIVDWKGFDVGAQSQVHFAQPNAGAAILNRVDSVDPSRIFGRITADGQVFLSNPQGVYFGPSARVDVGALVATTNRVDAPGFMAGSGALRTTRDGATGAVVNEGELRAALGGYIALLAPEVRNAGAVIAHQGTVALAAGEAVDLVFDSRNRLTQLRVEPATIRTLVENRHAVQAPGGLIILSAQALDRLQGGVVRNSGTLAATGIQQQGGRVLLSASARVENTGTVSVDATAGSGPEAGPAGRIEIQAPEVVNAGRLSAAGANGAEAGTLAVQAAQVVQAPTGTMDAAGPMGGGRVEIRASGTVDLAGTVRVAATAPEAAAGATAASPAADTAAGGDIRIQAGGDLLLQGARLDAEGARGGRIRLEAGDRSARTVTPTAAPAAPAAPTGPTPDAPGQGRLAMIGPTTVSVRGRKAGGGELLGTGRDVDLLDTLAIDARGATDGGLVLLGGDWQGGVLGAHPERALLPAGEAPLAQALHLRMDSGAAIDASSTAAGRGGAVVLWSDITEAASTTRVAGRVLAQGGPLAGDGGQVETSGRRLDIDGAFVSTRADAGRTGDWLLDPGNIVITTAGTVTSLPGAVYEAPSATTQVTPGAITAALANNNVTLQTGAGGFDITVASPIAYAGSANSRLTLEASRDIVVNADVSIAGTGGLALRAAGNITQGANRTVSTGGGAVLYAANTDGDTTNHGWIKLEAGSAINTAGGSVTLGGGDMAGSGFATRLTGSVGTNGAGSSDADQTGGVALNGASINAGSGAVTLRGRSVGSGDDFWSHGVALHTFGAGSVAITGGTVTISGTADHQGGAANRGVSLVDGGAGSVTISASQSLSITGTGSVGGGASFNGQGVGVFGATLTTTGSAALAIGGINRSDEAGAIGLDLNSSTINAGTGAATLTGTTESPGTRGGANLIGLRVTGATVNATTGALTFTGGLNNVGAAAGSGATGLQLSNSTVTTTGAVSMSGAVNVAAGQTGASAFGLQATGNTIGTTGGAVSLTGRLGNTGATAASNPFGLQLSGTTINATTGAVTLQGSLTGRVTAAGNADNNPAAVDILGASRITTTSGGLTVRGTASDILGTPSALFGTFVRDRSTLATTSGAVNVYGTLVTPTANVGAAVWIGTSRRENFIGDGNQVGGLANGHSTAILSDSGAVLIDARVDGQGTGSTTSGWLHGLAVISTAGDRTLVRTTSGNVSLKGNANTPRDDSAGIVVQVAPGGGDIQMLSSTGDLYLQGFQAARSTAANNSGIVLRPGTAAGGIRLGAANGGSHSGSLTIEADSITAPASGGVAGTITALGTGALTLQPTSASLVKDVTISDAWNFGSQRSRITIGKSTDTRSTTIDTPLAAAGPITLQGGTLVLQRDLTSTAAGAPVRVAANDHIELQIRPIAITTNAGAVTLASDANGVQGGTIVGFFGSGLTVDTRAGLPGSKSTADTGGGSITLGGGDPSGGGFASGALASSNRHWGIILDGATTLRSGGGDIAIRGRSSAGAAAAGTWAMGVGLSEGATIDSGAGRILIHGEGLTGSTNGSPGTELRAGVLINGNQPVNIRSAFAGADAIVIRGRSTYTGGGRNAGINFGWDVGNQSSPTWTVLQAVGAGGGLTLEGMNASNTGDDSAVFLRNGTRLLTNGGPLNITARSASGNDGILRLGNGGWVTFGSAAGSSVTSSSSALTISAEAFNFGGGLANVALSGAATIQPVGANFGNRQPELRTQWFNWNQNGQTLTGLTLGKPGMTSSAVWLDSPGGLTVNGPVQGFGSSVTVNTALNVRGDVLFEARGGATVGTLVDILAPITKTGPGDATLTARSTSRVAVRAIVGTSGTGAGTGRFHQIYWADTDYTLDGGVSLFSSPTLSTNGGHLWIGGSRTPGGSTVWNGLTVGDGAAAGSLRANFNAVDLNGTMTTGGGDVWIAGKTYVAGAADITPWQAPVSINAGSGQVTLIANVPIFQQGANGLTVNTTGRLTIRPFDDSFGGTFALSGAMSGGNWVGSTPTTAAALSTRGLTITNAASLGGLTIGKELNAAALRVDSSLTIAGSFELQAARISTTGAPVLTSTAGNILLRSDFGRGFNFDGAGIDWAAGGLAATGTAAGAGGIQLFGRGGTRATNNAGLRFAGTLTATGDVELAGVATTHGNPGTWLTGSAVVSAGRNLDIRGRAEGDVPSSASVGVRFGSGALASAAGRVSVTGTRGSGTSAGVLFERNVTVFSTTTAASGDNGIVVHAPDGGAIASEGTGSGPASTLSAAAGAPITLRADALGLDASAPLQVSTAGVLTIEPARTSFASPFLWNGASSAGDFVGSGATLGGLRIGNLAGLGGLTIGKAGNGGDVAFAAAAQAAGPIRVFGRDVAFNAAVTATGAVQASANRIEVQATGRVTQTAALAADSLVLTGPATVTLLNAGNQVARLAAGTAATPLTRLAYTDADGLTVGAVPGVAGTDGVRATGNIAITTLTDDLVLAPGARIASGATTTNAVVLNAGQSRGIADGALFFDGSGGDLIVGAGATVTTGAGGRATLYSGSVAGSTGLTELVGAGSGRFRYGSDEVTSNFQTALGTGLHAIYRERPTLTLRGLDQSVVYGDAPALGLGVAGLVNGDTAAISLARRPTVSLGAGGTPAQRNARGHFDVLRDGNGAVIAYDMTLSTNALSGNGYAIAYDQSGQTTVTPRSLRAVINDDARFIGEADTPGYAGATLSGFARGESAAQVSLSAVIARTGQRPDGIATGDDQQLGTYTGALTGSVSVARGNYSLAPSDVTAGTFHIVDPNTLIVRVGSATATYGDAAAYDVSQVRYWDTTAGQGVSLTRGSGAFNWNRGGNAGQAVNFNLASAGLDVGAHRVTGSVVTPHTLPGTANGSTPGQLLAVGARLVVTPRTVTVTATKTYDGSDAFDASQLTLGNLVGGQSLALAGARANDRNVATVGKHLVSGLLLDGTGRASNYQLPDFTAASAANTVTITPRELGVSVAKVYDGLATATDAQTSLTNLAAGEALSISGVQLSSARVAQAGKWVSGLTLGDLGAFRASNYALPSLTTAGVRNAVSIEAAPLVVTVASATGTDKVYDGSTATGSGFAATPALAGLVAGDAATLGFTAAYDDRNVSQAQRITLGGVTISGLTGAAGSVASDYAIDARNAFVVGAITPRTITLAASPAPTKVYDGTTGADGAVLSLAATTATTGRVSGDDVRVVGSGGTFSSANVGTGLSYTLADISLAGVDRGNYNLVSSTVSGSDGAITPRPLTLTAVRTYNGSTDVTGSLVLGNLVGSEYLNVTAAAAASARVAGPDGVVATDDNFVSTLTLGNVMDGGTVVFRTSNYSLPGSSAGIVSGTSTTLSAAAGNRATLTPAPLTLALPGAVTRDYDGSTGFASLVPAWTVGGLLGSDTVTLADTGRAFDVAGVTASSFTFSGLSVAGVAGSGFGSLASDYALTGATFTTAGRITPRAVAVDLTNGVSKVYDGSTGFAGLTVTLGAVRDDANVVQAGTGVVAGDALGVAVGGGGFDTAQAGTGKSYSLSGLTLTGAAAANYRLASGSSLAGLNGVVTPKVIQAFGLTTANRAYDGTTTASFVAGETGNLQTVAAGGGTATDGRAITGDAVQIAGGVNGAAFNSADVATANRVDFSGLSLTGADAANYTLAAFTAASITPRALTATTTLAAKTYDATTALSVTGVTLSGLVGSQTLGVTATGTLDDANAGSRTATIGYQLADAGVGATRGLSTNYSLASETRSVVVDRALLTITGSTAAGKVYDGARSASVTAGTLSGFVAGQQVGIASVSGLFDSADAGSRTVTASYALAGGPNGLAANYRLADTTHAATITPRALSIDPNALPTLAARTYDRTTTGTVATLGTVQGLVGTETLNLSATAIYDSADAGVGVRSAVVTYTRADGTNGGRAANYTLDPLTLLNLSIARRELTLPTLVVADKVYDRSTLGAVGSFGALSGVLAGDTVTVDATGALAVFAHRNVGSWGVSVGGLALGGAQAANYAIGVQTTSAAITPAALAVTGVSAQGRVYDGTRDVLLSGGAVSALAGDAVALVSTAASGLFADKNVGNAKTVTAIGYTLTGADAGNYALQMPTGVTADITPRTIAVTGASAVSRVYDATRDVALTGGAIAALAGDVVTLVTQSASGLLADRNVGIGKSVTAAGYALAGADAANYQLEQPTGLIADVTPRAITVTGVSAASRIYDGTRDVALSGGTVPIFAGDLVTLVGASAAGQFADRNVGVAKAVTVTGFAITGADAGNYTLQQPAGLVADVTARPVAIQGLAVADKVYDGLLTATVSGGTVAGLPGDGLTLDRSGVSAAFADRHAGIGKAVSATGWTIAGPDAANYALIAPTGLVASITPRPMAVQGLTVADKVYDGSTAATFSGAVVVPLTGDAVTLATGGALANFDSRQVGSAKPVTVTGLSLAGAQAGNYMLLAPTGLLAAITPAPLVVSGITVDDKVYDAGTSATAQTGGVVFGGLRNSGGLPDAVTLNGLVAVFRDRHVGNAKPVDLSYTLGGADAGNYLLQPQTVATASITPATLRLDGATGIVKTYDGSATLPAGTSGHGSLAGVLGADAVGVTGAAAFASANVMRNGQGTPVSQAIVRGTLALGGADAGNYQLAWSDGQGRIDPATLRVRAVDDAKFVTLPDPVFGVALSGFVAGEGPSVLLSQPSVVRTNAGTESAGRYAGALQSSGGSAANYTLQHEAGDFTIVPASTLLVRTAPATTSYGNAVPWAVQSASYLLRSDGSGSLVTTGGSAQLNGSGTRFSRDLRVGDVLEVGGQTRRVVAIGGDTGLTVDAPFATSTSSANWSFAREQSIAAGSGVSVDAQGAVTVADGAGTTARFGLAVRQPVITGAGALAAGPYGVALAPGARVDGGNFGELVVVGQLTVEPRAITPVLDAASRTKVYDGSAAMATPGLSAAGVLAGDALAWGGSGRFSSRDASRDAQGQPVADKAWTVDGIVLGGADAANYRISTSVLTGSDGQILPRTLNVVFNGVDKVYDGTRDATVTVRDDRVAGDALNLSATARFDERSVNWVQGSVAPRTVDITGVMLGGTQAANYTLAAASTTTARILPRTLEVAGVTARDRTYDGSTSVALDLSGLRWTGLVGGDEVTMQATGRLDDASAGIGRTVRLTPVFGGSDRDNYAIATPLTTTATIARRLLEVSATNGVRKVYDGTTAMTGLTMDLRPVAGVADSGRVDGDTVTLSGNGSFTSASVGVDANGNVLADRGFTLEDLRLDGPAAQNYELRASGGRVTGTNGRIDPRVVVLTPQTASKVYDGNTGLAAAASDLDWLSAQLGVAGDTVRSATFAFDDKNVGTGKTLVITGLSIEDGNGGRNFAPVLGGNAGSAITRLGQVRWIGGSSGNWFDPANWAGGAVPDLANVANVVIPDGVSVTFGGAVVAPAQAGPVALDSLVGPGGTLRQLDGALMVGGAVTLAGLVQDGGRFGAGELALRQFEQRGGELQVARDLRVDGLWQQGTAGRVTVGGNASIASDSGLLLGSLDVGGATELTSRGGSIVQAPDTRLQFGGDLRIEARDAGRPADVRLGEPGNDFRGRVSIDARDAELSDANGLAFDTLQLDGRLSVDAGGAVDLGRGRIDGTLEVASATGGIGQSGALRVLGAVQLSAGTGPIALNAEGNDLRGGVSADGAAVSVRGDRVREQQQAGAAAAAAAGATLTGSMGGLDARADARDTRSDALASASGIARGAASGGLTLQGLGAAGEGRARVELLRTGASMSTWRVRVTLPSAGATGFQVVSADLPEELARRIRAGEPARLSAADGSALPGWIRFEAERARIVFDPRGGRALPLSLLLALGGERVGVELRDTDD